MKTEYTDPEDRMTRSYCHGWSASPLYHIQTALLLYPKTMCGRNLSALRKSGIRILFSIILILALILFLKEKRAA